MNVMAIGAHPDDIEFGCGGSLLKHKEIGDSITYVCMTDTESVDKVQKKTIRSLEQLKKETLCASKLLRVDNLEYLPFRDLHVPFSLESISGLEKLIKKYNIDIIYTHWAGDSNQDHIATFKTTMASARYIKNVYCYEQIPIPRNTENGMRINLYNDITTTFSDKIKAAKCHESQFKKYKEAGFDVEKNLTTLAEFRGIQADCKYAEAFQIIKQVGFYDSQN